MELTSLCVAYIEGMKRKIKGNTVWKRPQKECQTINWGSVITILAQLGTLVTAIVALFALRESIFQRESMYKPEVFVEESYLCAEEDGEGGLKYYLVDRDSLKVLDEIVFPCYNLVNVGFGAALSANMFWHLDSSVIKRNLEMIGIKDAKFEIKDTLSEVSYAGDVFSYISDGVLAGWKVDYTMPYKSELSKNRGYYDPIISRAISKLLLWGKTNSLGNRLEPRLIFPVTLKYKDINDKWYTKNYEMTIDVIKYIDDKRVVFRVYPGMTDNDLIREFKGMGSIN